MKSKDYYTDHLSHDDKVHDVGGGGISNRKYASPIRLNDTFRSNITFQQYPETTSQKSLSGMHRSSSVPTIDHQTLYRQEYPTQLPHYKYDRSIFPDPNSRREHHSPITDRERE